MIREAPISSDQLIQQEYAYVASCARKHANNNNICVQTGEEFSMEFLKECVGTRGIPSIPDAGQIYKKRVGINQNQNQQLVYEDIAQLLGLKRMDSECFSDISDVPSVQGSCRGSENGSCVEKLSKYQKEDGDMGQVERRAFGELNSDRSHLNVFSPATTPSYEDFPRSNNVSGQGASDGSQSGKMKLLCSFGGKILPRPSDGKLRYVGGETRIITFQKCLSWEELVKKTLDIFSQPHAIKYQLPGEDLDALISVSSDEDLQNMIEEYNGLEKLMGSQRLRIFLIPLGESESASSLEASTIQQSNPDYHYMVAVNGVVDHNPKKNSVGQCLPSEGSQIEPALDHNPSFQKRCPTSILPLDTIGCLNALHPSQVLHDSPYTARSPLTSPPISPRPIQLGESKSVCTQAVGGNSSNESNNSFIIAHLNPENCGLKNPNYKQVQQVPPTLMNYNHPHVKFDASQVYQAHGGQSQNPDLNKNSLSVSVLTNNNDCYGVSRESLISFDADPVSLLSASVDPMDSQQGMTHAFSDTKLLELGGISDYCSQEGTSPSSPSNFAVTVPPSNLGQERLVQEQKYFGLLKSRAQYGFLDSDPTSESTLDILIFSSNPEASCRNTTIHKGVGDSNDKFQPVEINSSKSIFIAPDNYDEYASNLDADNRPGRVDPVLLHGEKLCEWRTPCNNMVCNNKWSNADCNKTFGVASDTCKEDSQVFKPSSLDIMNNIKHSQTLDKITYDVMKCCDFSGEVTARQGSITSCCNNPEVTCVFPKTVEDLRGESSVGDLISMSLNGPMLLEPQQLQCVASQKDISEEDMSMSSTSLHLSAVHVDSGLCSNLHKDDLHSMLHSSAKDAAASRREVSLIDDDLNYLNQNAVKAVAMGSVHGNSIVEELTFTQTETLSMNPYPIQLGPLVILDDVITSLPSGIEVSSAIAPSLDMTGNDTASPTATTDLVDIIPEPESEAAADDQDKDDLFSDAKLAEMEASIYGLQIIKDADLEDLRELGSGTYGTVYHGKWRGTDVAIKRIKKSCFSGRSSEQDRQIQDFWSEAQILSNLHHPNVVAFYGVVPDGSGGTLATVTEYMVNGSLRNALINKERSLDLHKRLIIAMSAAFGMEYLHSKNIVHFDLKCDNLLVNLRDPQRPICKIGDFGLSRIKCNTLVSGGVRGTLPWMAPELLNGCNTKVSEKVDVFSFGISMWEILTGDEPYADMHCGAIIGGILKNTLRPSIPECCHPDWKRLIEQCWSPDPDSRPSFTEIANRLRSISMSLKPKGGNKQAKQTGP